MISTNKLVALLKTLPLEIFRMCMSYTYSSQSKSLTNDIRDYVETRIMLNTLNKNNIWITSMLFSFFNNGEQTSEVFINAFYTRFHRLFVLNNKMQVDKYILRLILSMPRESQINICWGILQPAERMNLLRFLSKM